MLDLRRGKPCPVTRKTAERRDSRWKRISTFYGEAQVLKEISLTVRAGTDRGPSGQQRRRQNHPAEDPHGIAGSPVREDPF